VIEDRKTYPSGGTLLDRDLFGQPARPYVPAASTDIRETFARLLEQQRQAQTENTAPKQTGH